MSPEKLWTLVFAFTTLLAAADRPRGNPDQAWKELQAGNQRYVSGKSVHPRQSAQRRGEVAASQHPGSIILSCSDSRVPPEVIFDQGLGDVFVVRLAGNVVTQEVLGTIEYAAEHLAVSLVLVLGHERCGAVSATLKGGDLHGNVSSLVKAIQPAIDEVKGKPGDTLDLAVKANVRRVVGQLKTAKPMLAGLVSKGTIKVVGAVYDLDTGAVAMVP